MSEAQICPVWKGRQKVPEAFYLGTNSSTGTGEVQCRSCGGMGYIIITEIITESEIMRR
jgi:hypothetical protein